MTEGGGTPPLVEYDQQPRQVETLRLRPGSIDAVKAVADKHGVHRSEVYRLALAFGLVAADQYLEVTRGASDGT